MKPEKPRGDFFVTLTEVTGKRMTDLFFYFLAKITTIMQYIIKGNSACVSVLKFFLSHYSA